MNATTYMNEMRNAVCSGGKLVQSDGLYSGIEGHRRLAREIGYALNDFDLKDRDDILHGSYSSIYVIGCNLKPLLDAKEWNAILSGQIKE